MTRDGRLRVLVACERSQVVRDAFERVGCDAWSLDLLPCYGHRPDRHIVADAYECSLSGWDLIVAHPPCTYLTRANNGTLDASGRTKNTVRAIRLWYRFLHESTCPVAVENPVGLLNGICAPTQIIQPYHFGDPYSKETCLWLRGLPPLMHTIECVHFEPWVGGKVVGAACRVLGMRRKDRSIARSQTFPGIAAAMAVQWSMYLTGKCNPEVETFAPSTPVSEVPIDQKGNKSLVDWKRYAEDENKAKTERETNKPYPGNLLRPVKQISLFHNLQLTY